MKGRLNIFIHSNDITKNVFMNTSGSIQITHSLMNDDNLLDIMAANVLQQ